MPADTIGQILQAYEEGHPALFVTGRSLYDIVLDVDGKLRPLMETLRQRCRTRHGMAFMTYSMANGFDWDEECISDERDRRRIEQVLKAHSLLEIAPDDNEVVRMIRGIASLCRTPTSGLTWAEGQAMRFAFLFEFTEHLMPGQLTNGTQTDTQLLAIELAHITAQSLALRASGNLVLFHGREGLVDSLVDSALHPIRLQQPDREEKLAFLSVATDLYTDASFEEGITPETVAQLTCNTPNRGLETLLRASHRSGRGLTANELVQRKNRDVEQLSERTLTVLDTRRAEGLQLCGLNVATPRRILAHYATALMQNDRSMPGSVLLVGPPGTGKTDLAILTAHQAEAAAYQMHSPKCGIVGETERRARLQQTVLREWTPNIAFVDEITEAFPLERSDFDGDSGASRAVMAELLTALSDEGRRGQSVLIATTNCPWRMGAAMRSRFTVIPVLHPLREDFADIVWAIAQQMTLDKLESDATAPCVQEAATVFYEKGATPRHIRAALSNALLLHGVLSADAIRFAAHDLCASTDLVSVIYADLWAIESCSSRSFLPWSANPSAYPFPVHLRGVVDPTTGDINREVLSERIEEYRPHANV